VRFVLQSVVFWLFRSFHNPFSSTFFQTSIPVPSPGAGVIEEFLAEDGSKVVSGQQLFKLRLTSAPTAGKSSRFKNVLVKPVFGLLLEYILTLFI